MESLYFAPERIGLDLILELDALGGGTAGSSFALYQLRRRHFHYYRARIADLSGSVDAPVWSGGCPFCEGAFMVASEDGQWICTGCYRHGEAYTMEYLLGDERGPDAWERSRRRVDRLMNRLGDAPCQPRG